MAQEEQEEEEEDLGDNGYSYEFYDGGDDVVSDPETKRLPRPCELYVCNLPRSYDIPELAQMFKPFGTVFSIEISRNPETGISRGSGYVTLDSVQAAKAAIVALDGSDVGGREMRVKYSVHMNPRRRTNSDALASTPLKTLIYESPHKLYVGNLAWSVQPEELRNKFSKFGNVTSARVLHDRKSGKNRAYGFLSFASAADRDAARALHGKEFQGRMLVVRDGTER